MPNKILILNLAALFYLASLTPALSQGQMAFVSWRDGNSEVYLMNEDGSNQTNLTQDPSRDFSPAWSPGGQRLAFISDRSGSMEIHLMDADGSNPIQLTTGSGVSPVIPANDFSSLGWSPDGTRIAFTSNLDNDFEVYVLELSGGNLMRLTDSPGWDAVGPGSWSPDGEKIKFRTNRDGSSESFQDAKNETYCMNADGTEQTNLIQKASNTTGGEWPDGTRLVTSDGGKIAVMDADGSNLSILVEEGFNLGSHWSLDGSRISFASLGDQWDIFIVNVDGSGLTQVTNGPGSNFEAVWRPGPQSTVIETASWGHIKASRP